MDETRKTSAALTAEKEVPRAALDGVLTIDVDSKVESLEEQEDARWHQLLNAHRTRKILTGELGIPEFYVVLRDIEEGQESFILLDDEEQRRRIFCVRSFGFYDRKFIEFYRSLRWSVPGKVRIIGTKHQNVWNMRKAHAGICVAAGMVLGYVIPKIIEVMELFWRNSL